MRTILRLENAEVVVGLRWAVGLISWDKAVVHWSVHSPNIRKPHLGLKDTSCLSLEDGEGSMRAITDKLTAEHVDDV